MVGDGVSRAGGRAGLWRRGSRQTWNTVACRASRDPAADHRESAVGENHPAVYSFAQGRATSVPPRCPSAWRPVAPAAAGWSAAGRPGAVVPVV